MKLHEDWRRILRRAWAIRWITLAGVLSGAEMIMPLFQSNFPRGVFALLSFIATGGAFVSRLLAQTGFHADDQK